MERDKFEVFILHKQASSAIKNYGFVHVVENLLISQKQLANT
jgi:hypothetical protein